MLGEGKLVITVLCVIEQVHRAVCQWTPRKVAWEEGRTVGAELFILSYTDL